MEALAAGGGLMVFVMVMFGILLFIAPLMIWSNLGEIKRINRQMLGCLQDYLPNLKKEPEEEKEI